MLHYIAVDRVIMNDDGPMHMYGTYNHNYYWYEAQAEDRLWLVPWDLDSSFVYEADTIVHINPAWNAPADCASGLRASFLTACDPLWRQFAERRDEYERAVDEFLAGPFVKAKVDAQLAEWSAQIDAAVREASGLDGAITYEQWQQSFTEFQEGVETARANRGFPYDPLP